MIPQKHVHAIHTCVCKQALDEDQEGPIVQHRKLFEEDREFNQGVDYMLAQRMLPRGT